MAWALACLIKISRTSTYFIWTYMSDYYTDVCGVTLQTRETALCLFVGSQQWGRGAQFTSSVFFTSGTQILMAAQFQVIRASYSTNNDIHLETVCFHSKHAYCFLPLAI